MTNFYKDIEFDEKKNERGKYDIFFSKNLISHFYTIFMEEKNSYLNNLNIGDSIFQTMLGKPYFLDDIDDIRSKILEEYSNKKLNYFNITIQDAVYFINEVGVVSFELDLNKKQRERKYGL